MVPNLPSLLCPLDALSGNARILMVDRHSIVRVVAPSSDHYQYRRASPHFSPGHGLRRAQVMRSDRK